MSTVTTALSTVRCTAALGTTRKTRTTKSVQRRPMTQPIALARLCSAILPLIVAACSSPSEPDAPRPRVALLEVSGLPSLAIPGVPVTGTVTAGRPHHQRLSAFSPVHRIY
jgi:hypothetical protein